MTMKDVVNARHDCAVAWEYTGRELDGRIVGNGAHEARRELAVEAEIRRTNVLLEEILWELKR